MCKKLYIFCVALSNVEERMKNGSEEGETRKEIITRATSAAIEVHGEAPWILQICGAISKANIIEIIFILLLCWKVINCRFYARALALDRRDSQKANSIK